MKDLEKIFYQCVQECINANIPIQYKNIVEINTTCKYLKFCFGVCGKEYNEKNNRLEFTISIHPRLLDDDCAIEEMKEIIIHELIHTCPRCWSHSKTWIKYAKIMNEKYNYELTTAKSNLDIFRKDLPILHHYVCPKCGCLYNSRIENSPDISCILCGTKYKLID